MEMSGIQSPTPAVVVIMGPPPPFPAAARSVDLSALGFVLCLIGVVSIPALIYTFFFAIRCPRRTPAPEPPPSSAGVPYIHDGECPVCLSAFGQGDEVNTLSACGHAFHAACVDQWLSSHPNCPVCRADVRQP